MLVLLVNLVTQVTQVTQFSNTTPTYAGGYKSMRHLRHCVTRKVKRAKMRDTKMLKGAHIMYAERTERKKIVKL